MITILISDARVVTVLPDGRRVHAVPERNAEQAETANRLGYGDDVDAMTRDHDPLHSLLANWLGLDSSYSLRHAAGSLADDEMHLAALEEDAVLAIQRLIQATTRKLPIPDR